MSDPEGNSFIFPRVLMLPETKSRETSGLYICYICSLSLQQLKRITGANQNSRLGTYINANLIFKSTESMIHKVLSLYYLYFFSSNSCCFSSEDFWDNVKNRCFLISLRFGVCVAVFIHGKDNWQCFCPPSVTPLFTML